MNKILKKEKKNSIKYRPNSMGILHSKRNKITKWCSSLFQRQFCPRMKGEADQLCIQSSVLLITVPDAVSLDNEGRINSQFNSQFNFCPAPCCPRGSLAPYKSKENQFHLVLALQGLFPQCQKRDAEITILNT